MRNQYHAVARLEWVNARGQTIRVYGHRTDPHRNRITVNDNAYEPAADAA